MHIENIYPFAVHHLRFLKSPLLPKKKRNMKWNEIKTQENKIEEYNKKKLWADILFPLMKSKVLLNVVNILLDSLAEKLFMMVNGVKLPRMLFALLSSN